eukprot:ANDGO_04759.mRNA.1 Protein VdlD
MSGVSSVPVDQSPPLSSASVCEQASKTSAEARKKHHDALLQSVPPHWNGVRMENKVEMIHFLNPSETNASARIAHGATLLKLCDEAAAVVAFRHCRNPVVTASMDSVDFIAPVFLGDIIIVRAMLTYVSAKSVEIQVTVCAENLVTGAVKKTNDAWLTFVSVDPQTGKALPIPEFEPTSDDEKILLEQGKTRYLDRKERRKRSLAPRM